jgi:hypothetical protein
MRFDRFVEVSAVCVDPKQRDAACPAASSARRDAVPAWMQLAQTLASLVYWAGLEKLAYGLLPIEREPQWLPGAFDPKIIRCRNAWNP